MYARAAHSERAQRKLTGLFGSYQAAALKLLLAQALYSPKTDGPKSLE
jgi:hypothetical protein